MREKILVADDEERLRRLICAYLKREGYETLEAKNGYEALAIFKKEEVHLMILDIMMPIMNGLAVCNEIRKTSNVPIIFLTAMGENDDKLLGFKLGTDSYITKPFDMRVLIANVKSLMNRVYYSGIQHKKEMYFDGLYINELSHSVMVDDVEVNLSPKEYELLVYFAYNKNVVLSREKILDRIWGIDFFGDLRTVDSHVKRLRGKLGNKSYLISTVRGTGYKFQTKDKLT